MASYIAIEPCIQWPLACTWWLACDWGRSQPLPPSQGHLGLPYVWSINPIFTASTNGRVVVPALQPWPNARRCMPNRWRAWSIPNTSSRSSTILRSSKVQQQARASEWVDGPVATRSIGATPAPSMVHGAALLLYVQVNDCNRNDDCSSRLRPYGASLLFYATPLVPDAPLTEYNATSRIHENIRLYQGQSTSSIVRGSFLYAVYTPWKPIPTTTSKRNERCR